MPARDTFNVPSEEITVTQHIKGSKFITTVRRVNSKDKARKFIEEVRQKYKDATHNCYAYVAGDPHGTTEIGLGDDGEVPGTAGKPILSVLQHKKIGEIGVVVTRYFGGTKLGTGGLIRAYTSSVQNALDKLPLGKCQPLKTITIKFEYQYENTIRNIIKVMNSSLINEMYDQRVRFDVEVPENLCSDFINKVQNLTSGKIIISVD